MRQIKRDLIAIRRDEMRLRLMNLGIMLCMTFVLQCSLCDRASSHVQHLGLRDLRQRVVKIS
ncbi:uncharacterized protein BDV14DRAFT_171619 [Aspergillus stella-maris]|uniref:uncharacterized protein n=1 Tax=Aspergillus stella-maris TaxID=1810926 RepID=UPI003CCE4E38